MTAKPQGKAFEPCLCDGWPSAHLQTTNGVNHHLEILDKIADTVLAYRPKPMNEFNHAINQGSEIYVDSREIAKLFGIQHKNLLDQIYKNEESLTQLGQLAFETLVGKRAQLTSGNPQKFAWLNFDQIALLLTLSKPNAATREYRLRLVIAFRNARQKLRPVDTLLLSIPEKWKKTFKDEFYISLLRLYGDSFKASRNKPSWVGKWTNRFIYEPIFSGLPSELKAKRAQYSSDSGKDAEWMRLHQFIEENAKEELRDHLSKITGFLQIAKSRQDFIESFVALFGGGKQQKWDEFDDAIE